MKKIFSFVSALLLATGLWAAQTILAPGSSQLATAISKATAGDTIVFQTGTYTESGDAITLEKKMTFMAEKGATPTLVIHAFKIKVDFEINGINLVNASKDNYLLRTGGNVDGTIAIKNCSFKLNDAVTNPIGYIYLSSNSVGSLLIDNCIFSDNTDASGAILRAQSAKIGQFSMTNSTAYNMPVDHAIFCEGITNGYVDHCTFYNCGVRTVYMKGSTMTNYLVQNCIFMNPSEPTSNNYCVATYAGDVKNCMYYNVKAPRSSDATLKDCTNADPLFVDAANLNFCLAEGSPAIAAATDGKNLGDLRWAPKDDSVVEVEPGTGTLSAAIAAATKSGMTFVLKTGTYIESGSITIDKKMTIKATDGESPVIQMSSNFYLKDGGITIKDVKMDGNNAGDYLISVGGNTAMNIVLQGLEVCNYKKYMININDKYHVDSVFIDDCYIHDMTRSVIYCYTNTSDNNLPGCSYFKFTNSTAVNMGAYSGVAEVDIRNNSNDTEGEHEPTVIIDHVTMYNVLASNGAVKSGGGSVTITNSIFDLTASGKAALALAKEGVVKNTIFYETTPGADFTATDTLLRDPQFVNPAAKDLKFKKTSPAVGAGTDGTNIGDPRWGVQGDEYAFAMGDPSKEEVIYDPSYKITWSSNDPLGTATVTLEYATAVEGPWNTIATDIAAADAAYTWNLTVLGYGTYYVRGTLNCEFPLEDVAKGSIQYNELVPVIYYVAPTGDDANDGLTWATAKATINAGVAVASMSDTVKVAAGTYNESVSIHDGVNISGSYNPATGDQNLEAYPTVMDGTDLGKFLLVKYDNGCTRPTLISYLVMQNADHSTEGGAAYIRQNVTLDHCLIRNCTTSSSGGGVLNDGGVISNSTIELCTANSSGGAIYNKGGKVFNCIIRGNDGKYGAIRNNGNGEVYNCLIYNNSTTVDGWPGSGGIFNEEGTCYNTTIANNYGPQYAGCHSNGAMYNCLLWNNKADDGFSDPVCFVATNAASGDNAADNFFEAENFIFTLNADNMDAKGPQFVAPTAFVGMPKNAGEIAAMRAADFSLLATSPILNIGRSKGAPATDINGVARPKGTGIDLGAYEYDPDAPVVAVTGIELNVDTLFVVEESSNAFAAIFTPRNATNRNLTWWIEDESIATIDQYGAVVGIKPDTTRAAVKTEDGGFTDTAIVVVTPKPIIIVHPEVLAADSLYKIENYTIPSFIPFWMAKETARKDSAEANLQAMRDQITKLVSKENPYCLIANINGDPKTRMAFNWFTNEGITNGKVQIVAKANATEADFSGEEMITLDAVTATTNALRYAVSTSGIIKATGMDGKTAYKYVSHKAIAEDLTPGTVYSYRVGYDTYWSEIATFETAKAQQGEYSFLLMSDSHIQDAEYVENARACAEAAVKNVPDAKFVLFPGDAEETGTSANSEWEWEQWFETSMRPALYKMPFVPTDGNHEDTPNGNWDVHYNTDTMFNVSSVVKPQFKGITYSFVYGDVLFLVFSMQDYWRGEYDETAATSEYLTRDVGNWMKAEVANHPECKYRVTVCHKNVFSGSGHQEDDETPIFRNTMLPIFKECEIDLALQGHDHCYEVMGPVVADSIRPITDAIAGVKKVAGGSETNMTGLEGGTFTVDDGTLYFIGATCGRKRYYPYTRAEMDANFAKHRVTNYYDLFTSKFGQPGSPMYTKVTVKSDGLYLDSYNVSLTDGSVKLYNSIKVVRTKAHAVPTGYEQVQKNVMPETGKFISNGQLIILREGKMYNAQGLLVK